MTDPRLTPDPGRVTGNAPACIRVPVADLNRTPAGPRDRQMLFGDAVTILSAEGTWRYVQSAKDDYCGYVNESTLGPKTSPTHWVSAPATHTYVEASLKSPDRLALSFGSRVTVRSVSNTFADTEAGFVPTQHLAPLEKTADDPAAIAALFLGTPYLWGGNSRWGIDCSGLIQAALLACGIPCPGDSDLQMALGVHASIPFRRNDLLFWKGHVALVTDPETLIHANAHAMATCYEPISDAIARIKAAGDGPVTAHRRLPSLSG